MRHHLELDFRDGAFFASCKCGTWRLNRISISSEPISAVYDRIEDKFQEHVEESAEKASSSPSNIHQSEHAKPTTGDTNATRGTVNYHSLT
jgi:hypothetical protein